MKVESLPINDRKLFALSSFLILMPLLAYSQDCGNCSRPRVLLYDSEIRVLRPTDPQAIITWFNLFPPGASARAYLHNQDPNKNCIQWIDGALVNATDLQKGTLKFGTEYLNLPPAGKLGSGEYLITGAVEQIGTNNYRYRLILETAISRKTVKTVEVEFEATPLSAFNAGEAAAREMTSLCSTITKYERNARNGDTNVAISDLDMKGLEIITIKPEKTLTDTDETINVDVTMTDCDGVPLGNRKIIFKDTTVVMVDTGYDLNGTKLGEIKPSVAYTDEQGKVTVRFKAGNTAGTAEINAWHPHYKPCGRPGVFHRAAFVQIKNPPVRTWLLDATISQQEVMDRDTTKSYVADDKTHKVYNAQRITTNSSVQVQAVIENNAAATDSSFNFYYGEPLALIISGSGFHDDDYMHTEIIDGEMLWITIMNTNISGSVRPGASIDIEINNEYKYFTIDASVKGSGSSLSKLCSGGSWLKDSTLYQD